MRLYTLSALLATCLPLYGWAQAKLVEKITKRQGDLVIPYEKYVLPNGLTLIIHEDHSDPLVHVDVTYHVGSAREEIGKSGFAHFFEHMMFQGSKHVADEEHFKIVTESGGTLNGTTNRDRTNYFETLPSNQLEVALWLEADRMGFLLPAVTQEKFEVQRATVKNERGQNYDNRPYGLVREYRDKTLYPYGHPYSWLTIGYVEDLDRVNVDDLKNFFLRWYGPNNATLTVGGDVNPREVVQLVEKYFGSIPPGPRVEDMPKMTPVLNGDRFVSYEDPYIKLPMLYISYPAAPQYSYDELALDCIADLLGQGKNAILYQKFIKAQKAVQANAFNSGSELSGEFNVMILPYPGVSLADMLALYQEALKEFETKGISQEDIERFKAQREAELIYSLESVSGRVRRLAAYQTFLRNPNFIQQELSMLRKLNKDDVWKAYQRYIQNKPAVYVSVCPKGMLSLRAAADNYSIDKSHYKAPTYGYAGLSYREPKDNFDRSRRPEPKPAKAVQVPPYWKKELGNGIPVIGTYNDEVPIVNLLISFEGGHVLLHNQMDKLGLADLTANMLEEDTQNYTAEAFENELKRLGSSIDIYSGETGFYVQLRCLSKNLQPTMRLLEERLLRPRFTAESLERLKKQQLESVRNNKTQARWVASDIFNKLLFGLEDVRAYPTSGTEQTIPNLTLDDVESFYRHALNPAYANVVFVGEVDQEEALRSLAFLGAWQGEVSTTRRMPNFAPMQEPEKTKIYLVDIPNAAQSEIRVGHAAMPYHPLGTYYAAYLMCYPLGGAFNSRINLNLREDKGWTYGARATFSANAYYGYFVASAGVKASATDSAVYEFIREISDYVEKGPTEEELNFTKLSIGQRDALSYELGVQKASFLRRLLDYNLEGDYVEKQSQILHNMDVSTAHGLARQHLRPDKSFIVVVGDKQTIYEGLKRLGYSVFELDKEGNPITLTGLLYTPTSIEENVEEKVEQAVDTKRKTKQRTTKPDKKVTRN